MLQNNFAFWTAVGITIWLMGVLLYAAWYIYLKDKKRNAKRIRYEWPHQDWHTPAMRRGIKRWPLKDRHVSKHFRG